MIFTYNYQTIFEDFSKDAKLTLPAIIKILENAGGGHSDIAGDNVFNTHGVSRAWILTDWQIEILSEVTYGQEIKVETWSEGFTSPLVTNRNFIMYKNGEKCLIGTTRWILLDLSTGRPSRLDEEVLAKYQPEKKTVFDDAKVTRIPSPEAFETETRIPVQRRDIDINDHVHNVTYLDYALETLPSEIYLSQNFSKIRITYKTALKEGDTAVCKYAKTDDSHVIFIYNESDQLCAQVCLK